MTAVKAADVDKRLASLGETAALVLLYGPDQGLVRERANAAAARIAPPDDPFNAVSLDEAEVKSEPARLADEAAAFSFAGGRRVVRLRASGEGGALAPAVETFLADVASGAMKANALVVVEAGGLGKASKLRKAAEGSPVALACPCYEDGAADVRGLAVRILSEHGLSIDEDAAVLLSDMLGEDRGVTRSEIEKLATYLGPGSGARASRADVVAVVAGGGSLSLYDAADAALDGDAVRLDGALFRHRQSGGSPIALIRAFQSAVGRHVGVEVAIADGEALQNAMSSVRPPLFGPARSAFAARRARWPIAKLEAAARTLVDAELAAKSTGAPQIEIAERAALRIARLAAR